MKVRTSVAALLFAGAGVSMADTINWPANNDWNPLYSSGVLFSDISQDVGNNGHLHLDIVGDSTYAGGYLMYRSATDTPSETEDQLLLRIRVNNKKNKMSGAYQIFFETDGDAAVEWVMQLITSDLDSEGTLEFGTADGTNPNGVTFGAVEWTGTYAGNVNWTGIATSDGSQFGGDDDYYLDLSMPWQDFSSLTGITSTNDAFRLLITSSQSSGQILDGDVGSSSVAATANFSFDSVYSDVIPEPTAVVLILLFGTSFVFGRRIFGR